MDYVHISEGETEQGGQPQQPSPQLRNTVSVKFCGLYDVGLWNSRGRMLWSVRLHNLKAMAAARFI